MTSTEKKSRTEFQNEVCLRLSELYAQSTISEMECFRKADGTVFRIAEFPSEAALIVEYAENLSDAEHGLWEDGDRIYISGETVESVFEAIRCEIESL